MPLQSFTPQQIQQLIAQFNSQVRVPEHQVPLSVAVSKATITDHGIMASTSTSGILPFPSRSLTFENDQFKFHNHCLSTLPSFLPSDAWTIDSGASSHVCSDLHMFTTLTPVSSVSVSLPNGTRVLITHTGTIHISASLILYNVLHVPDFQFNLISVSCLVRSLRCAAHFFLHGCFIQELSRGLMIGKGNLHRDLYILDTSASTLVSLSSSSSVPASFCGSAFVEEHVWHQRLGHPSSSVLHNISRNLPSFKRSSLSASYCPVCPLAKQKRLAFISNNTLSKNPFDLVHLDIWGPFKFESVEGYKYFLTLVDDCTRVTWIYMLKNKSDVSTVFPAFLNLVSTQFDKNIKAIRSNNAPELAFPDIVAETGMIHYFFVLIRLSKTQWLKENINTCLMLLVLYCFSLKFH